MKPSSYRWNLVAIQALAPEFAPTGAYPGFQQINGNHPWKYAVPNGFIEYQARILRKSKIVYFNFALAKEMGLVAKEHPNELNPELEKAIISTFALRIVNEHDQLAGETYPAKDLKAHRYMATRYLQLQHNCKTGTTSGDGRSIWNGQFLAPNGTAWDVSSCGTGVTRLSPGSVQEGRPVKTGDNQVSYGSGLADIDEGLTAAILSESFHARGILTERTLVVLESPSGDGINVRTAKNLLRPSHLFLHLKQGNQLMLKSALDFHIAKQIHNRDGAPAREADKYDVFLGQVARSYAEFTARLEDEYIFCWLDWDGDNMLMGGGIIDYGSIRQFGLCHHRYRYDDVNRFSTNLKEQKTKARHLVQTFVQMVHFVRTGEKKDFHAFASSSFLKTFDRKFRESQQRFLLQRTGLSEKQSLHLIHKHPKLVQNYEKTFRFFERKESRRGMRATADGVNNPAIFAAHALLRELPRQLLLDEHALEVPAFLEIMQTPYLTKKEMKLVDYYGPHVKRFQSLYMEILKAANSGRSLRRALLEAAMRASQQNSLDYATGDGILNVVDHLLEKRKQLSRKEFHRIVEAFIHHQQARPSKMKLRKKSRRVLETLLTIVHENKFTV